MCMQLTSATATVSHIHTYIHTYTYIYIHIYIHTHIHMQLTSATATVSDPKLQAQCRVESLTDESSRMSTAMPPSTKRCIASIK
jgi:hypothetical protein